MIIHTYLDLQIVLHFAVHFARRKNTNKLGFPGLSMVLILIVREAFCTLWFIRVKSNKPTNIHE